MMGRHQAPLTERVLMLGLTAADPTSSTSTISVTSTTTYRNYQAERSRPRAIGSGEWHEKGVTGRRPLCLGHPHCAARSVRMQARAHLQTPPTGVLAGTPRQPACSARPAGPLLSQALADRSQRPADPSTRAHRSHARYLNDLRRGLGNSVSATVWRRALRRDTTR